MPLRDHFHPPLSDVSSWEEIHGGWPMVIVQQLGKVLPPQYMAGPRVHLGSDFDEYEVRVFDTRRGRRLVAAIELVSPANKDRPEHRSQFTSKCAALLRQSVSLVLVDVVTARNVNLYADLLDLIGEWDPSLGERPPAIYAVACRWRPRGASRWLESWNQSLQPGLPLPSLPLWLTEDFAIPLDLEASYEQTCRDLRIA